MASSKEYLEYVLELLRKTNGIYYRKMMGEYIIYKNSVVVGGVYDNRFLIKKSPSIEAYHFIEALPYPGGSLMYLVSSENPEEISLIINNLYNDLKK